MTEQPIATGEKCGIPGEQQLQSLVAVPFNQITNEEAECLKELRRLIKGKHLCR